MLPRLVAQGILGQERGEGAHCSWSKIAGEGMFFSASHMASSLPVDKFIGNLSHHVVRLTFGIARWVANLGTTRLSHKIQPDLQMLETQKNIPTVPTVPQKHLHLLKEIAWPFQLAMFLSKKLRTTMKPSFPKTRVISPMLPG